MATHSSVLAWRIPLMEELGGLQSTGRKESDTTERLHFQYMQLPKFLVFLFTCYHFSLNPNSLVAFIYIHCFSYIASLPLILKFTFLNFSYVSDFQLLPTSDALLNTSEPVISCQKKLSVLPLLLTIKGVATFSPSSWKALHRLQLGLVSHSTCHRFPIPIQSKLEFLKYSLTFSNPITDSKISHLCKAS